MTDKQVQSMVSQAIAAAQPSEQKCYHICWWQEQFGCHHVHHTKDNHAVFYTAPGYVFIDGLTPFQWNLVTTRVADFFQKHRIRPARPHRAAEPDSPRRVTEFDSMRLRTLLATARTPGSKLNTFLDKLQRLLEAADIVTPRDVPGDVVTMNSRVCLRDDHTDQEMALSLVFPADAARDDDIEQFDVSILSPLGLSLLGRRVGELVEGGIRIHELGYQPEAAGDFHL